MKMTNNEMFGWMSVVVICAIFSFLAGMITNEKLVKSNQIERSIEVGVVHYQLVGTTDESVLIWDNKDVKFIVTGKR
jgi:hypothetical protein